MSDDKIYKGNLVLLNIKGAIAPELAASDKLALTRPVAEARIAERLAAFLTKHFLTVTTQADGSIVLSMDLRIMLDEVPPGVAHTKILFKKDEP